MRVTRRWIAVGAIGSIIGAGVVATRGFAGSSPKMEVLTSEAFNALHDQARTSMLLTRLRRGKHTNNEVDVVLYRLLGCPYCARVKTVMDFLQIPYTEVVIDPISGSGIADPRYPFAPQLALNEANGTPSLPPTFVVDSAEIISKLAVAYSFEQDLADPRETETRKWIADRFQGVTFAALNSSWMFAFYAYPDLVPPKYGNVICRCIGATALYALANFKITPKLRNQASPETAKWLNDTDASKIPDHAGRWILEESKVFTGKLQAPFHGGQKPDLADVEMFAVVRNIMNHKGLEATVTNPNLPLGGWLKQMEPYANGTKTWMS